MERHLKYFYANRVNERRRKKSFEEAAASALRTQSAGMLCNSHLMVGMLIRKLKSCARKVVSELGSVYVLDNTLFFKCL